MSGQDWKATTFSLSVADVAALLSVPPSSVLDMMTTGTLGFWVPPAPEGGTRGTLAQAARFDPEDVRAFRESRPSEASTESVAVLGNLRAYLAAQWPPTTDYTAAMDGGRPLSIDGRVHVRVDALLTFARSAAVEVPAACLRGPTERVLASVCAERRRGLRPEGSDRQRWQWWWLLPESMWSGPDWDLMAAPPVDGRVAQPVDEASAWSTPWEEEQG